jgi:hypothetical protein
MPSENRNIFKALSGVSFGALLGKISKLGSGKLIHQLSGKVTDEFLELLFRGMKLAFFLMKDYRKNIQNFSGRYFFNTSDGCVAASVVFKNGKMKVLENEISDWNIRITFKNAGALRRYLFSKDQDILNSILANEVEVTGNLNYIYKFGFMVRELMLKFGIK